MSERLIPLAAMEKLMRNAGAERVSDDAKEQLKQIIEDKIDELGKRSAKFAEHAGRKTVKSEDIKLAINESK